MVRKILSSFLTAILVIGITAFASDAFAGDRSHHRHNGGGNDWGAFAAGTLTGIVVDRILTQPRVVYQPSVVYAPQPAYVQPNIIFMPAPQPQIVIVVPGGLHAGQNAASGYRASAIRSQADWQVRQDAWDVCRKMGPPYC